MSEANNTKTCPFCAETIQAAAIVCRYCGRDLPSITELQTVPLAPSQPVPIQAPVSSSQNEVVYFQNQDATVTSSRILLSGKTYALANVTSVTMAVVPPDTANATGCGCAGVFVGAIALGIGAISSDSGFEVFGALLAIASIAGGIGIANTKKIKYLVRLGSASGESDALWAYNKDYIQKIVNAINEAIVKRG